MRVLAISHVPAYYQVPIFRGLADALGNRFLGLFASAGQSAGVFEPTWGQVIHHDTGLLEGYPNRVLGIDPAAMGNPLTREQEQEIANIVDQFAPTAVFTNRLGGSFSDAVIAHAKRLGAKVVLRSTPIDLGKRPWWKKIARRLHYRRLYRQVDAACAVGKIARAHFENAGIPPHRVIDANYCTDEWVLCPLVEQRQQLRDELRRRLDIPAEERLICYAGRFVPVKRIDMLVEAAAALQSESNVHWVIAGSGPLWDQYKAQVEQRGLKRVTMPGLLTRQEVARLYASSEVMALPSAYEPFGVVTQEAMMFGCAVVASDVVGSAHELIRDGVNGYMFPDGDTDAFVAGLKQSLDDLEQQRTTPAQIQDSVKHRTVANAIAGVTQALELVHHS